MRSGEGRWVVGRYLEPLCVRDAMGGTVRDVGVFERESVKVADKACVQAPNYEKYLGPYGCFIGLPHRLGRSKISLVWAFNITMVQIFHWRQICL